MLTLAGRAARGAALLDQQKPGWADQINLSTLNMQNCENCALGQLFGDFWYGLKNLKLKSRLWLWWMSPERQHGFMLSSDRPLVYEKLTLAWRKEILERKRWTFPGDELAEQT